MESLGPHPILFVEMDSEKAIPAEKLMSGWGLHVSSARSGREAIELTKTRQFEVLLITVDLVDINAYELASAIRNLGDQFQSIPIIGYGRERSDVDGNVLTDFISHPFNEVELHSKLKTHLDKMRPEIVMATLDRCAEGDPDFRRELAQLLANNVAELMTSIDKALAANNPEIFIRSVHKTKTTLGILNDAEMLEEIRIIQGKLKEPNPTNLQSHIQKMIDRCIKTIDTLKVVSQQE
jgi:DNA-binding response OmpR family regulator